MGCCASTDLDPDITNTNSMGELIKAVENRNELYEVEKNEISDYLNKKISKVNMIDVEGIQPALLEKRILSLKGLIEANKKYIGLLTENSFIGLNDAKNFILRLQDLYKTAYVEQKAIDDEVKQFEGFIQSKK